MKLNPGFDDELQLKRQGWRLPVRSIGQLMVVVLACALTFAVLAGGGKRARNVRPNLARLQRPFPVRQVKARVAAPPDRFVVTAAAEIDAGMVVPAPAGDEAMVFNPYAGQRLSEMDVPLQGALVMPAPGGQPGQAPENTDPPLRFAPAQLR